MSLTLYFLRHGETTYSRTGGYCGALDPDLTDAGLQMAEAFANAYRTLPWTDVYASPMKRTIATGKPLCDALAIDMQLRDGLKEIAYGEWEGKTNEDVKQHDSDTYMRWMTEPAWNAPPGGETAVEIASRASLVIAEIENKYTEGNVLIVSHKATIRIMLCSLLGIDLGRYRDRLDMPAASLSTVKFSKYGPMLQSLGDRAYMGERLRKLPGT
ncbi:MAG: histidine phosphatase family protein [Timaviella obliquedivisa GSE-PSE-MK23-08B]|nr:histidine phosphatase family protein [Timaviella obliquedivisa GSE-PSE-MK23-08B]